MQVLVTEMFEVKLWVTLKISIDLFQTANGTDNLRKKPGIKTVQTVFNSAESLSSLEGIYFI